MTSMTNSRIRPVAKFFFEGDKKFFVKGVTYGPFKPDAEGSYLGRPEQVDVDLALMRQAGLNVVRVYHAPPRWLGTRRVIEFVEELIRMGRAIDPAALFSYATYPPTEYLLPQNADFCCFNVYLHNQRDFEGYLLRLQNITGEHPLILGEFGMDTIRHSQEEQAEMLGWHIDSVVKCGLAGTILFTWTDEWFTGGQEITDWAFGIVTRQREPKKAFYTIQEKLGPT